MANKAFEAHLHSVTVLHIEMLDVFVPTVRYFLGGHGMNALVTAW